MGGGTTSLGKSICLAAAGAVCSTRPEAAGLERPLSGRLGSMNIGCLCVTATLAFAILSASANTCSQADGEAAADAVDHLTDWSAVHGAYKRFAPQCDDGGVAEGFSDGIVHLLATKWGTLPSLGKLFKEQDAFMHFVLRHVDSTTDYDELRAVVAHSTSKCPSGYAVLCRRLNDAASAALSESEPP